MPHRNGLDAEAIDARLSEPRILKRAEYVRFTD